MSALKYWLSAEGRELPVSKPDPAGAAAAFPHAGGRVLRGGGGGAADRAAEGDPAGEQGLRRCGPGFQRAAECEHPHPPGRGVSPNPAAEYLRPALSAAMSGAAFRLLTMRGGAVGGSRSSPPHGVSCAEKLGHGLGRRRSRGGQRPGRRASTRGAAGRPVPGPRHGGGGARQQHGCELPAGKSIPI